MELGHIFDGGTRRSLKTGSEPAFLIHPLLPYVDLHLLVQPIVDEQRMGHPDTMRLHRMPWPIVEVADIRYRMVRLIERADNEPS